MLINLKKILGHKLAASDGDIGHVKDFYFDDKTWAVRYLVADTGAWLPGRAVLLSPYSFGPLNPTAKGLEVRLTRKHIENSPPIDSHRPVSRQYEENYHRYYGWPTYWEGGGVWGASDFPALVPASPPDVFAPSDYHHWDDLHLRSAKAVTGFSIEATDGVIGSVSDFLMDDKNWQIRDLTVQTGHWYAAKEILISIHQIDRVSPTDSKVLVKLSKADIQRTAEHQAARAVA
jgi:uncharacterized protein YrrD